MRSSFVFSALLLLVQALTSSSRSSPSSSSSSAEPQGRPNIVLILVDDQDARQNSIDTMSRLQSLLVDNGTKFTRFFAPISVCCPSRTSLLRAQAAHNTNITHVIAPWGGWEVFNEKGFNGHYLPNFLQSVGYSTRYVGKLMNDHKDTNYDSLPAEGWTESQFLVDPFTYDYWHPVFTKNNVELEDYEGHYSTDVVTEKALKLLENAASSPEPFFVGIAPIAPHSHMNKGDHITIHMDLPQFAPRHAHLFQDVKLNTSRLSHNPDVPSGASWVKKLDKLNETHIEYIEEFYRSRLRALQAVDELVEGVVNKLEALGVLDNTIIIYTSDNGFESNGGHRRQPGKTLPYEEDINVPLVVRGPDVEKGLIDTDSIYSLSDLGATILHLAGATSDYDHDGALVPLTSALRASEVQKHHSLVEYWVQGVEEGKYGGGLNRVNQTYRAVRVVEGDINYSYAVWCTGERELYDLNVDPDQMDNLLLPSLSGTLRPHSITLLQHRLDALLLVLKTCVGDVCRSPWSTIFPSQSISTLIDALDPAFEDYFAGLPKVSYSKCDIGYHRPLEHPFWHEDLAFGKRGLASFVIQS